MPNSWLHTAAKNGDSDAQIKIGLICYMGHSSFEGFDFNKLTFSYFKGLCKNSLKGIKKAIFWIKKGHSGNPKHILLLAYLYELLLPSVFTKTKSLFYYKQSFSEALHKDTASDLQSRLYCLENIILPKSDANLFDQLETSIT